MNNKNSGFETDFLKSISKFWIEPHISISSAEHCYEITYQLHLVENIPLNGCIIFFNISITYVKFWVHDLMLFLNFS